MRQMLIMKNGKVAPAVKLNPMTARDVELSRLKEEVVSAARAWKRDPATNRFRLFKAIFALEAAYAREQEAK